MGWPNQWFDLKINQFREIKISNTPPHGDQNQSLYQGNTRLNKLHLRHIRTSHGQISVHSSQ